LITRHDKPNQADGKCDGFQKRHALRKELEPFRIKKFTVRVGMQEEIAVPIGTAKILLLSCVISTLSELDHSTNIVNPFNIVLIFKFIQNRIANTKASRKKFIFLGADQIRYKFL